MKAQAIFYPVMPGLVPGIPLRWAVPCQPYRDGRGKPGHDD
jgi:hypothetical protein